MQLVALAYARGLAGCSGEPSGAGGSGGSTTTGSGGTGGTGGTGGSGGAGSKVVVVGGGLAGLCAAYELKKSGFEVVAILEAQKRTGGRVQTLRDGWKNNQYAELGATRIADSHNFTLQYVQEFGLTLREFTGGTPLYSLKGNVFTHADGDPWPDFLNLKPEEKSLGADSLVLSYEKLDELGDPTQADWPTGKALDYDAMSIFEYLTANGASEDVLLIDRAINGGELTSDAALYWLMADVVDKLWDKTYAIEGGNDQLPAKFTDALADLVKYEHVVTEIAQDDKGVKVTFDNAGTEGTVEADRCVVAIPFTTLRKVKITPELSAAKKDIVQNMSYMPVSRCYLQTKTRFWQGQGIGGLKIARTDTPIERLWDLSNVQDGDTGMILAYMQNQSAVDFAAQAEASRVQYVADTIAGFFPEINDEVDSAQYKIWQDDPWVGGGWGYFKPGEVGTGMPAAKAPEGRLHFCGEHTSPWSGWMQGAFESANRVVKEIVGGTE